MSIHVVVLEWVSSHLSQLALWAMGLLLLLMTAFRHEMSCNAIYDDWDNEEDLKKLYSFYSDHDESDEKPEMQRKSHDASACRESIMALPPDVQVHLLTYLTPGDVTRLACVNREFRQAMDGISSSSLSLAGDCKGEEGRDWEGGLSNLIWMALWKRDYASLVTKYHYGVEALKRSLDMAKKGEAPKRTLSIPHELLALVQDAGIPTDGLLHRTDTNNTACTRTTRSPTNQTMKEFYFLFQQTWLPYLVAGHANFDSCLIGLHGHLFDMSEFLHEHPGSPETLLMQSGRDATLFFESVGHSSSARALALSLSKACLHVVDWGCCAAPPNSNPRRRSRGFSQEEDGAAVEGGKEIRQQQQSLVLESHQEAIFTCGASERHSHCTFHRSNLLPHRRSKPPKKIQPPTLHSIRRRLMEHEQMAQRQVQERMKNEQIRNCSLRLGEIHVFWDPIGQLWMSWYIDTEFKPIFEPMDI